jgi:serine/threonine-protein kinase RsbT
VDGEVRVPIRGEDDIVAARQAARDVAKSLRFGMVDQSRIATAVSELTRNIVRYATDGCGETTIRPLGPSDRGPIGIEIIVSDDGPGIEDLELAMRHGYTSGPGLGVGLPGTRRLMDDMEIDTGPGRGTVVTIRKWRR